ncbi:metallophosphoesterase [Roseovarius mucosus]|nr:metallophosphoesterase [Roseovarius mucosus]
MKPVNILHISDLHYKTNRSYDQGVVLDALLRDVSLQSESVGSPDLIVFSGDLVHSADDERIYEKLYDHFIDKLLRVTNCDHTRIFLTPGNHDLSRKFLQDHTAEQAEIEQNSNDREKLNGLYLSGRASEIARLKSQEFFDFAGIFEPEGELHSDAIASLHDLKELGLSIVSLNTAWMGRAGIDKQSDLQRLAIPEAAISNILRKIPQNRYVIFNFHHPFEWHAEHGSQDFKDLSQNKGNLFLYGHVHDPRPVVYAGESRGAVHNQAGALYTWRQDRYLGYAMIRVEPELKHTELCWRSYFDKRRAFDTATNVNDNLGIHYSSAEARNYFATIIDRRKSIRINEWVEEKVKPFILDEFSDGILDRPTPELFVAPPLSKLVQDSDSSDPIAGEVVEHSCTIEDILADDLNYLFEAYPEHGKTAMLYKLCMEIANSAATRGSSKRIVPVLLQFSDFAPGTKRVEKAVRDKLPGIPEGCDVELLLYEGCFTICIDDVNFSDTKRMKELRDFISKYKNNRFFMTTTTVRRHESLVPNTSLGAHFERIRLHQFRRPDLRKLIRKIDEANGSEEELLDRVIAELRAMNVPATPLNSSLLMDILSRDSNFSPINRPTLIERFIETLLKKRSLGEVERKKFDFRNQVHYLGFVAEHMCRTNKYVLDYDELFGITSSYLKSLGLNFGAREIIDNTIHSKIFSEKRGENCVSFRFRAFLEFFVATRMREQGDFKKWIFEEDRYLSYLNEIEYYSGLERNDLALLQMVSKRHLGHHLSVFGDVFDKILDDEQFSKLPNSLESSKRFADDLAEQMKEAPLSAEERDEVLDAELPRDAEGRQEVFRPSAKETTSKYILSLFMYTSLVKNTELIEDTEKRYHLSCVLKSWSSSIVASFLSIPSLVKNRRMTLNGLTYIVSFPRELSDEDVARKIALGLPKEIARLVHLLIATEKLEYQLTQPTIQESGEPNITAFLRSSLYIDLKLRGWWKEPGRFIDRVQGDVYFQEVMLSKAADVYRLGAFSKTAGQELEDEIVETYARLYSPSRSQIGEIRNKKKADMRRIKHLRTLRAKLPINNE